jgi:hypothetical protein
MKRKATEMEHVVVNASFKEAEDMDTAYYASLEWQESAAIVEEMRMQIWSEAYERNTMEKVIRKASLTDDRDDFE